MPIYMKYEGIEGPVTGKYKGWIELDSCQLGSNRNITSHVGGGSGRESSAPSVSEVVIIKSQDSTSVRLFTESLSGKAVKVTIDFVKGDDAPYLSLELEGTLISSYSFSGHGNSQRGPMETISLNFTKITYAAKPSAASKDPKTAPDKMQWDTAVNAP